MTLLDCMIALSCAKLAELLVVAQKADFTILKFTSETDRSTFKIIWLAKGFEFTEWGRFVFAIIHLMALDLRCKPLHCFALILVVFYSSLVDSQVIRRETLSSYLYECS